MANKFDRIRCINHAVRGLLNEIGKCYTIKKQGMFYSQVQHYHFGEYNGVEITEPRGLF